MTISKRAAWFLVAFAVWSWIIWPVFLKNIWADRRSWHDGMTAFFTVHLVLTIASLGLGTAVGAIGVRALRSGAGRRAAQARTAPRTPLRQTPLRRTPLQRVDLEPADRTAPVEGAGH